MNRPTSCSNSLQKTVNAKGLRSKSKVYKTTVRKALCEISNLLNITCDLQYEKLKSTNALSTRKCTNRNNSSRGRSYLNYNQENNLNNNAMLSRKAPFALSPTVVIEKISVDDISNNSSFDSCIVVERLSAEILSKHLKQCNVVLTDDLLKSNQNKHNINNFAKTSIDGESQHVVNSVNSNQNQHRHFSLRKHNIKIDYAEFDRQSSLGKQPVKNHVPVYKTEVEEKVKTPNDVYEFDSDSENKKAKKRRKNTLDASVPFENDVKIELQRIELRLKKKTKRKQRPVCSNKENRLKKVKTKIYANTNIDHKRNNLKGLRKDKQETKFQKQDLVPVIPAYVEIENDNDLDLGDVDSAPLELEICTQEKATGINIINKNRVPDSRINILQNIDLHTVMNHDLHKKIEMANVSTKNLEENSSTEDNKMFNFDALISPVAKSTPWRADMQVRRNPFFLQYKDTMLPTYNQDMVIDSTCMERVLSGNKTPKNLFHDRSKTKQSSILSFINGKNLCDTLDVIDSSLFDIHKLSPVKSGNKSSKKRSNSNSASKENQYLSNFNAPSKHDVIKVKRQILADKVDNTLNISNSPSNNSNIKRNSNSENEISYFGFESSINTSITDESQSEKRTKDMWLFGKPFRVEKYFKIGKTYKDKVIKRDYEKEDKASEENLEGNNSKEIEQQNIAVGVAHEKEDVPLTVGLFDDLEPINVNNVSKKYDRAHRKRVRRYSVASNEGSEDEHPHPRKRKKDKRTKDEKDQAEKWAKDFNKMCEEVDNFPLEIE